MATTILCNCVTAVSRIVSADARKKISIRSLRGPLQTLGNLPAKLFDLLAKTFDSLPTALAELGERELQGIAESL
jgi:hypothetical protein